MRICAILLSFVLLVSVSGCAPSAKKKGSDDLPRAKHSFVQWMGKQSMLTTAGSYLQMVAGANMQLKSPSVETAKKDSTIKNPDRISQLLSAADAWMSIHPATLLIQYQSKTWNNIANIIPLAESMGLRGIYVAPTAEHDAVWKKGVDSMDPGASVALRFASHLGTDENYEKTIERAESKKMQLGGQLVPFATGLGPDFMLSAQWVRGYPGTYLMLEVPKPLWTTLPKIEQPFECVALDNEQVDMLSAQGIIPAKLARKDISWVVPGGWAATGEVRGHDGISRRWVYRYDTHVHRPILNWDNPAGAARDIIFASIIREVGIMRQALVGVGINSVAGLDVANSSDATLEPGLSALNDITREVRRYGGWSMGLDVAPLSSATQMHSRGLDFAQDGYAVPYAALALITEKATDLKASLEGAIASGVDHRRFVRSMPATEGLALASINDLARQSALPILEEKLKGLGWQNLLQKAPIARLNATSTSLAVIAVGALDRKDNNKFVINNDIIARHRLLTLFSAGLPGLFKIDGQDIVGALANSEAENGGYTLCGWASTEGDANQIVTRIGQPRASMLYGSITAQLREKSSYASFLQKILEQRKKYSVSQGQITKVLQLPDAGMLLVLIKLPEGAAAREMAIVTNFGKKKAEFNLNELSTSRGTWVRAAHTNALSAEPGIHVKLFPYSCQWYVLR